MSLNPADGDNLMAKYGIYHIILFDNNDTIPEKEDITIQLYVHVLYSFKTQSLPV